MCLFEAIPRHQCGQGRSEGVRATPHDWVTSGGAQHLQTTARRQQRQENNGAKAKPRFSSLTFGPFLTTCRGKYLVAVYRLAKFYIFC